MTTWLRSARTTRRCVPRTWGCGGGRAGPGGAGRRAMRGEVTRAARADRRGHDHASEEGHAHGRGLQTVRGEEGPPGEVPELRREPRPRTRLSEDGGLPAAADAAAPQVAGGKTIPNDAKPMDLKKTVSEPARAPRPTPRARRAAPRARARPGGGGGDDDPPRRCQRRPSRKTPRRSSTRGTTPADVRAWARAGRRPPNSHPSRPSRPKPRAFFPLSPAKQRRAPHRAPVPHRPAGPAGGRAPPRGRRGCASPTLRCPVLMAPRVTRKTIVRVFLDLGVGARR